MRVGLIDVDGHNWPSLPLMKISAHHKAQGDVVEFYEPLAGVFDVVYMSKVFTFTPDYQYPVNAAEVIQGGTGYGLENDRPLPPEIENLSPDYSLYNTGSTAYGFLTRGCPRNCGFCIVTRKEGATSHKVADLCRFWNGQREIKLLDPNILASRDRAELLEELADSGAHVDFTQGLDVRLTDERVNDLIMKVKVKRLHFAWDCEKDSGAIVEKLTAFKRQTGIDKVKAKVYVLTNYDTDFDFDLERVYRLRDMGFDPYVMIYDKEHAERKYRRLQRWVNAKQAFNTVRWFEDYKA